VIGGDRIRDPNRRGGGRGVICAGLASRMGWWGGGICSCCGIVIPMGSEVGRCLRGRCWERECVCLAAGALACLHVEVENSGPPFWRMRGACVEGR